MGLIDFEKPAKVVNLSGIEDGPDNGYIPQMSTSDAQKWRGKRTNKGKEADKIEIKKQFGNGTMVVIFVAKDGWDKAPTEARVKKDNWTKGTRGLNFRMSMNGPLLLTMKQYEEFDAVVREAWDLIKEG